MEELEAHYDVVAARFKAGKVIPFLGAGANLCGRPSGVAFEPGRTLPVGAELAHYIADEFAARDVPRDELLAVSQWVSLFVGTGPLYEYLHQLLDWDYAPTSLHTFFGRLPALIREKRYGPGTQIIITTNYDDVLERAFQLEQEPYDLVAYIAEGEHRGKFWHHPHGETPRLIEVPNEYDQLDIDKRSLIVKIHGDVNRETGGQDSYVITEDHYIEYLARTDLNNLVPPTLLERLQNAHFLFLGYSLRDWNLRVILHRIAASRIAPSTSWAIMRDPGTIDRKFWNSRDVDIFDVSLEDYIAALDDRLRALTPAAV